MTTHNTIIAMRFLALLLTSFFMTSCYAFAAKISIDSPGIMLTGKPVLVQVLLDTEGERLSGIEGDISIPQDLASVSDILLISSAVSPWLKEPHIAEEKYLDGRIHVTFEGIFPGGFSGVKSAYYQGEKPGILFSLMLTPKRDGVGSILADSVTVYRYNEDASQIHLEPLTKSFSVSGKLEVSSQALPKELKLVPNTGLSVDVSRDPLIDRNLWHLVLTSTQERSAMKTVRIAESSTYNASDVPQALWRTSTYPYTLLYQDRSRYIHVLVEYMNDTYTIVTVPPVENSQERGDLSRILLSIIVTLSFLYIVYEYYYSQRNKKIHVS